MEGERRDFSQESVEQKITQFFDLIEGARTELEKRGLSKDVVVVDQFKERMEKHIQKLVEKKKTLGEKADHRSVSFQDSYGSHMSVVPLTERMRKENSESRSPADLFQNFQKQEAAVPDPDLPVFDTILEGQQFVKNSEEWRKKFDENPVEFLNFDFSPEGRKIFFQNLGAFDNKETSFHFPIEGPLSTRTGGMKKQTDEYFALNSSNSYLDTKNQDVKVGYRFTVMGGGEKPGSFFATELQFSGEFLKKMIEQEMSKQAEQK